MMNDKLGWKYSRQDDNAVVESCCSRQNAVEGLDNRVHALAGRNVPVVGIEVVAINGSPDDRGHAHSHRDGTDTVVDVTIRRTHGVGRNTGDLTDSLASPAELSNDLLVGEGRERRVRPGVDGKLMASHVLGLEDVGARDGTRTDDEEG